MVSPIQLHPVEGPVAAPPALGKAGPRGPGFDSVLREVLDGPREVKFSAHALARLRDRNITLTESGQRRIAEALDQAEAKGGRNSLLLMDRLALVVSVPNRTVVTAFEPDSGETSVFTNIDSVVILAGVKTSSQGHGLNGLDPVWGGPVASDR